MAVLAGLWGSPALHATRAAKVTLLRKPSKMIFDPSVHTSPEHLFEDCTIDDFVYSLVK
jgi:hypothetical protein